jgi:hypothetical protein
MFAPLTSKVVQHRQGCLRALIEKPIGGGAKVLDRSGRIDVLVNNAGLGVAGGRRGELTGIRPARRSPGRPYRHSR